jgi:hypothetical protein
MPGEERTLHVTAGHSPSKTRDDESNNRAFCKPAVSGKSSADLHQLAHVELAREQRNALSKGLLRVR